jgi:thiosulfate reductase cytochrome b subunit
MMTAQAAKTLPGPPEVVWTALGLTPSGPHYSFYRHSLWVRLSHWINAVCLAILLLSGLNIFNAHPALYWGSASDFNHPALMLGALENGEGGIASGVTSIGHHQFDTTGVLGASQVDGELSARGFPSWATLPGPNWLAMARQWHFAFAWLLVFNALVFFAYGIWSRHFVRDLAPTAKDIRHLPREIADHARFKFPHGKSARHYNAFRNLPIAS